MNCDRVIEKLKEFKVIVMSNLCPQCGAPIESGKNFCQYCGTSVVTQNAQPQQPVQPQPQPQAAPVYTNLAINPAWPVKSKIVAGVLALFLGGIGVHKFYLGKTGMGILYILFCWTYIPTCIAFVEGIIYLCSNDENFQLKHHVRLQ